MCGVWSVPTRDREPVAKAGERRVHTARRGERGGVGAVTVRARVRVGPGRRPGKVGGWSLPHPWSPVEENAPPSPAEKAGVAVVNRYDQIRGRCERGMPPPSSEILITTSSLFSPSAMITWWPY